ncbi:MAG TPA: tetratricopeptide repeat protein [Vicinamibacterales bacterium]
MRPCQHAASHVPTRTVGLICLVLLAGAAAPRVAAQNREHQQLSAELRILQDQQQQLALAVAQIAEALKALPARIDDVGAVTRKGFADQELRVSALAGDVGLIRERTQDTDTRLRSLRDEIDALRATLVALQAQITQLAQTPAPNSDPVDLSSATTAAPASPAAPVTPPPATSGLSPSRMLDSAKSDYFAGAYTLALSGFEAVLRTFPRTESAAEAQFYIGETYSQQKRWLDAVGAYTLVVQNFPTSSNVPEAYFRRGRAYEDLGQTDAARASWELVVKTYPDTTGATLAQQGLNRLTRKATP